MPSTTLSPKPSIVMNAEVVTRICSLFEEHVGQVDISADCADGVDREFTAAELIAYDNAKSRQLNSLRISARALDFKKSASLQISRSVLGIHLSVSCANC